MLAHNWQAPYHKTMKTPWIIFRRPLYLASPVTEAHVSKLFSNLDVQKASFDIPNKLIKIAEEPLSKPVAFTFYITSL